MVFAMQTIKRFFSDWWNVLTLPSWYSEAMHSSGIKVFFFTLTVLVLLTLLKLPQLYLRDFPAWRQRLETTVVESTAYYPDDLSLTWNGSTLEITPNKQTIISFPSWWTEAFPPTTTRLRKPTHLAIIQPETASSTEKSTWFLLSEESLSVNNWMGTEDRAPWSELLAELPPTTINAETFKKTAPSFTELFDAMVGNLWPIIALGLFLSTLLFFGINILWESLFFYVLFRLSGTNMSYGNVFKFTTFLFLAAATIKTVATWLYPNLDPIWETVTVWAYFFVVVYTQRSRLTRTHGK
jgi:hypothetical protein